jgi:hypothetical protein
MGKVPLDEAPYPACRFLERFLRTTQVGKNPKGMAKPERNLPSGAKALFIPLALSARLKPCPFKTTAETSFSATCTVVFHSISGRPAKARA